MPTSLLHLFARSFLGALASNIPRVCIPRNIVHASSAARPLALSSAAVPPPAILPRIRLQISPNDRFSGQAQEAQGGHCRRPRHCCRGCRQQEEAHRWDWLAAAAPGGHQRLLSAERCSQLCAEPAGQGGEGDGEPAATGRAAECCLSQLEQTSGHQAASRELPPM